MVQDLKVFEPRYNLARIHLQNGDDQSAERLFRELVERAPHQAEAYIGLVAILNGGGQASEAKEVATPGLAVALDNANLMSALALASYFVGDLHEAQRTANLLVERYPQSPKSLRIWPQVHNDVSHGHEQIAALKHALELEPEPDNIEALSALGSLYVHLRLVDDAYEVFLRLALLFSKNGFALFLAIDAALSIGEWDVYRSFRNNLLTLDIDVGAKSVAAADMEYSAVGVAPIYNGSLARSGARLRIGFLMP
ncbi:MAG: tetratricopeptide repeat protein [Alphaproteobacteria bacterium]|nr:tetratricopeptide repeat protein [Alphaproteobacteria bacterium]